MRIMAFLAWPVYNLGEIDYSSKAPFVLGWRVGWRNECPQEWCDILTQHQPALGVSKISMGQTIDQKA